MSTRPGMRRTDRIDAAVQPAGTVAGPDVPATAAVTLRAVTFNVRHGLGLDGAQELARVAEVLERLGPDLAGLQELDEGADRSGRLDQARWLADRLGMQVAVAPARGRRPTERVALLARAPIQEAGAVWFWDGGRRGERRGAVLARVALASGPLTCAVAHLSTRRRERRHELRALAATLARVDGPVVALIDANTPRVRPLTSAGLRPPPGRPPATFPADQPRLPVDWILARPPVRHLAQATAPTCRASDHRPLLALLGL
jgi:endonuclease/exonuclease/phosphatase family metal-dependent hydrolase